MAALATRNAATLSQFRECETGLAAGQDAPVIASGSSFLHLGGVETEGPQDNEPDRVVVSELHAALKSVMSWGNLIAAIQAAVRAGQHLFTVHAISRAGAQNVTLDEVEQAMLSVEAEVIEDYPNDPRGPSCLVYGRTAAGEPLHIVCSYPPRVAIITCYRPDPTRWAPDLRTRRPGVP